MKIGGGWGEGETRGICPVTLPLGGVTSAAQVEVNGRTNNVKGEAEKGGGGAAKVVVGTSENTVAVRSWDWG